MAMTQDNYGYVLNSQETYDVIAVVLGASDPVLFSWTDESGTVYDILFNNGAVPYGPDARLGRGLKFYDLFVSVIGKGAFGFGVDDNWKSPEYIAEKLGLDYGGNVTSRKLAELINGVIASLRLVNKL